MLPGACLRPTCTSTSGPTRSCACSNGGGAAPRLRRDDRGWTLELAGEPPSPFDLSAHDPGPRAERARADGLERVIVAPSTPLGIEALPAREAQPLLDAFHAGVLELGAPFGLWASASRADELDALLDAGAVGLCLPADALGGPEALRRVGGAARAPRRARRSAARAPGLGDRPARALVVAGDDLLRGRDADRVARLGGVGPRRPPGAQGRVGDAGRLRPAARRAPRLARRPRRRRPRRPLLVRRLLVRPEGRRRDAARGRRRPARERLRPPGRRPAVARHPRPAFRHAVARVNPAQVLS